MNRKGNIFLGIIILFLVIGIIFYFVYTSGWLQDYLAHTGSGADYVGAGWDDELDLVVCEATIWNTGDIDNAKCVSQRKCNLVDYIVPQAIWPFKDGSFSTLNGVFKVSDSVDRSVYTDVSNAWYDVKGDYVKLSLCTDDPNLLFEVYDDIGDIIGSEYVNVRYT